MRDSHSSAIERNFEKRRREQTCEQLVVISSEFSAPRNKPTYGRRCDALGYRVSSFRGRVA